MAPSHSHPVCRGAHHQAQTPRGKTVHHSPVIKLAVVASGTVSIPNRARVRRDAAVVTSRSHTAFAALRNPLDESAKGSRVCGAFSLTKLLAAIESAPTKRDERRDGAVRRPSTKVLALYDKDGSNTDTLLHKSILCFTQRFRCKHALLRNNDNKQRLLLPVYSLANGAASTMVQHKWHCPPRSHNFSPHRDTRYECDSARRNPRA